jgi:hypothetical protein
VLVAEFDPGVAKKLLDFKLLFLRGGLGVLAVASAGVLQEVLRAAKPASVAELAHEVVALAATMPLLAAFAQAPPAVDFAQHTLFVARAQPTATMEPA